jgi:ABC-type sugar transport system ATPase subunit
MGELSDAQFEMRGVRKAFGATVALDAVNLAVRAGEVCALVGQNGAGKSTLMSVLSGATRPDAGTMTLKGEPYAPAARADAGVPAAMFIRSCRRRISASENIALGMEPAAAGALGSGFIDRAR